METNVIDLLRSPLVQSGNPGDFIRQVLAEAAAYGMPGPTITLLDDIAAMLGMYAPLPKGPAAHLAGPIVSWRTDPVQPTFERVHDVEKLVFRQRALLAFGGGPPGQTVGTAEICCAIGNIIQGMSPPEYYDLFTWASLDVLSILTGDPKEKILKDPGKKGWRLIDDEEVLTPGGRLWSTYQEVATSIRREAIANLDGDNDVRKYLRPVAAHFIESHARVRAQAEAEAEGLAGVVKRIDEAVAAISGMFPDLKSVEQELPGDVERRSDSG